MPNFIKILLAVFAITIIAFYTITYYIEQNFENNNKNAFQKWEKETFFPDQYQGTILNAEDKYGAYRIQILLPNTTTKELMICQWQPELKAGDTIIKNKNNKNLYYLRNGKNNTLHYKFCY